MKTVVIDFNI
ncbi:unnamed protein product [Acanthoscelides obtectus]|uniref:Uncharacterized protein n=1 Tax=Acanthoscelides obtectus TaxID=200917 RepID=A0A9P0PFP2_ACAOB|nr:unnamed protein product [Acanthoscelides obtectus]CAK1660655.1 hypothetical protein AOBTE_LOCUS22204 [Acanthoscelides obtectus]